MTTPASIGASHRVRRPCPGPSDIPKLTLQVIVEVAGDSALRLGPVAASTLDRAR